VEIMPRIERRRKWTADEKAALLAEVEAAGGSVSAIARRYRISESVIYNWRAAMRAAATAVPASEATAFIPLGVVGGAVAREPAMLAAPQPQQARHSQLHDGAAGAIEIALPNGARVSVDAFVNEKALGRVLRAMKGTT
jgi:transposase